MADKTEGVLEMLDAIFDQLLAFREDDPPMSLVVQLKANRERDCKSIRGRVAELLAADEELDDARIAACQTSVVTPLDQFTAVMDRFYAAQQRRAAAIRAMRGES